MGSTYATAELDERRELITAYVAVAKQLGDTSKVDALGKEMEKLPASKQASTP